MKVTIEKLVGLYHQYEKTCHIQEKAFSELQSSGKYATRYLNTVHQGMLDERARDRRIISQRMRDVKADFITAINNAYDLERYSISPQLTSLLNSGVVLSKDEFLALAQKHATNLTESRIIHDMAQKDGYDLRNYVPREKALECFDNYLRQVICSLDDDPLSRPFDNGDQVKIAGNSLLKQITQPPMDIADTPQSVDEAVALDLQREKALETSSVDDGAFVAALTGRQPEPPTPEDNLTSQEVQIAKSFASRHGGEITEEDAQKARKITDETMAASQQADHAEEP